jgi:hypothetical protein
LNSFTGGIGIWEGGATGGAAGTTNILLTTSNDYQKLKYTIKEYNGIFCI